jgi:hypothetical protein
VFITKLEQEEFNNLKNVFYENDFSIIDTERGFDGTHYKTYEVKYLPQFDSKKENVSILVPKFVSRNVENGGKK